MLKIKRQLLFTTEIISEVQSKPSRKRPVKMQRLSGRLREVIVYKSRTTGRLFREKAQAHLLYGR